MRTRTTHARALTLLVGLAALAACGTRPAVPDHHALDRQRTLGAPIEVGNLTVWPLYTNAPVDVGIYHSLHEAETQARATIRERGAVNDPRSAEVAHVVIENTGTHPIFVLAGTIIHGGHQDRQIGHDAVIAAGQTADVRVFCVERGRWGAYGAVIVDNEEGETPSTGQPCARPQLVDELISDTEIYNGVFVNCDLQPGSGAFSSSVNESGREACARRQRANELIRYTELYNGVFLACGDQPVRCLFSAARVAAIAPHAIRTAAQFEGDQQGVWAGVHASNEELDTTTETDTLLAAIEGADDATQRSRAAYARRIRDAFGRLARNRCPPVGFAYAINGRPISVRAFADARLLASQFPLLLGAMALEAQLAAKHDDGTRVTARDVIAFVQRVEHSLGAEQRMTHADHASVHAQSPAGYRARCLVAPLAATDARDHSIALSEDWTARVRGEGLPTTTPPTRSAPVDHASGGTHAHTCPRIPPPGPPVQPLPCVVEGEGQAHKGPRQRR